MGNFNIKIDRPKLSDEQIKSKENFDDVLSIHQKMSIPIYKKPWFWGSAGLATLGIATVISLNTISSQSKVEKNEISSLDLPADTECIKPPLKDENVLFETFNIDTQKDEKIILTSGSTIYFPKGALLPENENQKVEIKIREFRDMSSSFVAGIPMDYQKSAFESAGMIEIRGNQNDKEVEINQTKPISVDLVCTKDPSEFDFWKLNETSTNWEKFPATKNSNKTEKNSANEKNEKSQIEKKIVFLNEKIGAIDDKLIQLKTPEKADFKIPTENHQQFDLAFDKNDYPELAKFENLLFEVVPLDGYDKSFTKKNWSDVELKKEKNNYFMHFQNSKEKFKINVRPVLKGKELKIAENEFDVAIKENTKVKNELAIEKKNTELQVKENEKRLANLLNRDFTIIMNTGNNENQSLVQSREFQEFRNTINYSGTVSFQTTRWGVFNADKPILYPNPLNEEVIFSWKGREYANFKKIIVFNLEKNSRFVYGTAMQPISNFGIHKKDDLVILGIDSDGNLGYKEFKNRTNSENWRNIEFSRKDKSENTTDLLKKLLNETTDIS
jgi:hypothetical protein